MRVLPFLCGLSLVLPLICSGCDIIPTDFQFNANANINTTSELGENTLERVDAVNETLATGIEIGPETRDTIEKLNETIANGVKAGFDEDTLARVDELLRVVEDGLKIGLDDETLNSLDGMVATIDRMPGNWESSTSNIIQTLENSAGTAAGKLADEVTVVMEEARFNYQQMTAITGIEFRCNVDFLGSKVGATAQEFIGKNIVRKLKNIFAGTVEEETIPTPWVCQIMPDILELSEVGDRLAFEDGVITLTGYNFVDENSPSAMIVDESGGLVPGIKLYPYRTSSYQIQLNLQEFDFSLVPARSRIVFVWPNVAETSGIAILLPGQDAPVANFSSDKVSGSAPLTVQFSDTSSGNPTQWEWVFGDGDISLDQNPSHTFLESKDFQVQLTVKNSQGESTVSKTISIGTELTANFTFSPTSSEVGELIVFKDTSSGGPTSWLWDFGDTFTSTEQNPTHLYMVANPDGYTVKLTVQNDSSTSTKTANDRIEVVDIVDARFEANKVSGRPPFQVIFTNESLGGDSIKGWLWDFGDGTATSIEKSPKHTYTKTGKFSVMLTVTRSDGEKYIELKDALITSSRLLTYKPRTLTATIKNQTIFYNSFSTGSGGTNYDTNISYDKYVCGVSGFTAKNGVISTGHIDRDGLRLYMYPQNSPTTHLLTWWIVADFQDTKIRLYPKETWTVNTVCFSRTLEGSVFLYRDDFRNMNGGSTTDTDISTSEYFNCGVMGLAGLGATGFWWQQQYPVVVEADVIKDGETWAIKGDMDVADGGDAWDIKTICLKQGSYVTGNTPSFITWSGNFQTSNTTKVSTGISAADYVCGVDGFKAERGDLNVINPFDVINPLPSATFINPTLFTMHTYQENGIWWVEADIASFLKKEDWTVDVLCVRRPIAVEGMPPN